MGIGDKVILTGDKINSFSNFRHFKPLALFFPLNGTQRYPQFVENKSQTFPIQEK
jgi:hypothetical protein